MPKPEENGQTPPTVTLEDLIPEEYKEKAYLQNIKSIPDLFKSYDNAQALIGKKTIGIPDDKATPEERNEFFKKLGKPDTDESYEIIESHSKVFGEEKGKFFDKKLKNIFFNLNLTAEQSKKLQSEMLTFSKELMAEISGMHQQKEKEIMQKFEKITVPNEEKEKATLKATKVLEKFINKDLIPDLNTTLDEKSKIILSSVLSKVHDEYLKDDKLPGSNLFTGTKDIAVLNKEIEDLVKDPVYYNPSHPEYKNTRSKMYELQKQKKAMTNGIKK